MHVFPHQQSFTSPRLSYTEKRALSQSSLYIAAGGNKLIDFTFKKIMQVIFPQENIHWVEPNFKEIDTYIMFYLCSYDVQEAPILTLAIHDARSLLKSKLKPEAHILIMLYRDLKVAFPQRKLQREKVMSEMISDNLLQLEAPVDRKRIQITHEFGIHDLQDSFQQLKGRYFYFELMPLQNLKSCGHH